MRVDFSARSVGLIGLSFRFSLINMKVCCVFSLESPDRGDSNDYTQYTIINIKRKSCEISQNTILFAAMGCFWLGTQEQVRNSRGKRAISVRAIEVLLFVTEALFQNTCICTENACLKFLFMIQLPQYHSNSCRICNR